MSTRKVSEAQLRATRKYDEKNRAAATYRTKKSATKHFILKQATDEDLEQVKLWIDEREENDKKKEGK